ncbi:pectinesterase family protein [Umezawaea sp. Da 62-37]|uniref:pectinesterase family protein n=1 Tax=Umezawaea sp. Da 62-37 TaxID=3075927 RepID=UPI0028F6C1C7|nr:pectinesterase family protein [Umezawaea sp. Da 62-37]WNV86206.1 pectinesterase family protein [Umezawaea sp. Da 62-37]
MRALSTVLAAALLLGLSTATANAATVTVAADGSGNYRTLQAAVNAVSAGTTISIARGTYRETVTIPAAKSNLVIQGATGNPADVVLVMNKAAKDTGSTLTSATVTINSPGTTVRAVTFNNDFAETGASSEQAVALAANGDRQVYDNVRVLGNQDTLLSWGPSYTSRFRQYFRNSYVEGDVDFIFGLGTMVFANSTIHSLSRGSSSNNGYVTAAATDRNNTYGFLFSKCTFTSNAAAGTVYLGRPWSPNGTANQAQVVIRESTLGAHVRTAQPWTDMGTTTWKSARFFEYANTGAGAGTNANRPQLSSSQAATYTPQKYLAGSDGWNPAG